MPKSIKIREGGKNFTALNKENDAERAASKNRKISIDIARNMCYNINGEHR